MKFHVREMLLEEEDKGMFEHRLNRKEYEGRFNEARPGDHVFSSLECDVCVFIVSKGRFPMKRAKEERILLNATRKVNLNVFWSR